MEAVDELDIAAVVETTHNRYQMHRPGTVHRCSVDSARVGPAVGPAVTRVPTSMLRWVIRPSKGATTCPNDTSWPSSRTFACAAAMSACAACTFASQTLIWALA